MKYRSSQWLRVGVLRVLAVLAVLAALAACTTPMPPPPPILTPPAPVPEPAPAARPEPAPAPAATPPPPAPDASELLDLLAYHQRLRSLGAAELTRELSELASQPGGPANSIRRAMLLSLGREGSELALAQQQLERAEIDGHNSDPLLRPLARLLSAQLAEQRRLSDSLARLGQQLKDSQRRNEQLSQTLEALKAIEQKLPAAGNPAAKESRP